MSASSPCPTWCTHHPDDPEFFCHLANVTYRGVEVELEKTDQPGRHKPADGLMIQLTQQLAWVDAQGARELAGALLMAADVIEGKEGLGGR